MNILSEIIEKSDNIIGILSKTNFFNDYPFIDIDKFKYKLQVAMQYKWEQYEDINLTSKEFSHLIHLASQDGISETLYEMSERELLSLSVNKNGKLVYTIADNLKKRLTKRDKQLLYIFTSMGRTQTKK